MAKINSKVMNIGISDSPDVVGYRVRVANTGSIVNYDTPYTEFGVDETAVDVATLPAMANVDGDFDFYVSSVDDAGNESDFATAYGIQVDFLAPSPPNGITF